MELNSKIRAFKISPHTGNLPTHTIYPHFPTCGMIVPQQVECMTHPQYDMCKVRLKLWYHGTD